MPTGSHRSPHGEVMDRFSRVFGVCSRSDARPAPSGRQNLTAMPPKVPQAAPQDYGAPPSKGQAAAAAAPRAGNAGGVLGTLRDRFEALRARGGGRAHSDVGVEFVKGCKYLG